MLIHVLETCQIRKFEGVNVIRYVAWPATHGSFRDDRHGRIVTSGHHSLPELDTIFLAVIRWRSCSIVVVAQANLCFYHVRGGRIATFICELAALFIKCKRWRFREVVTSRFTEI